MKNLMHKDKNIIKENQDRMTKERTKDMIHETLKCGGGHYIGQMELPRIHSESHEL
jgi:hypothetical protein